MTLPADPGETGAMMDSQQFRRQPQFERLQVDSDKGRRSSIPVTMMETGDEVFLAFATMLEIFLRRCEIS
jgi:hypothetical protein